MFPHAFIVVHGGAGVHGTKSEKEVKQALKNACTKALTLSDLTYSGSRYSPRSLVERSIRVLEDDEHLNAGYGSNLTIEGTVECDAAIMDVDLHSGRVSFGSVGALAGIKNPISAACTVLDQSTIPNKLGLIPPLTLVSNGAHLFATFRGVLGVPPESLISPAARVNWQKWKTRLENSYTDASSPKIQHQQDDKDEEMSMQDTVGAIACLEGQGVAAGVSSGGLLLKCPGRIGEAATYGAGCWATTSKDGQSVACSVSGTGEHITKMDLARRIGEVLSAVSLSEQGLKENSGDPHSVLEGLLSEFWQTCKKDGEDSPSAGVIVLTMMPIECGDANSTEDNDNIADHPHNVTGVQSQEKKRQCASPVRVRLWCAFTTASMAVGYASTRSSKPKATIFRQPNPQRVDQQDGRGDKPQIYITSISLSL
ncbi:nucleophile aminohydrolase [Crepidotus variabilis]|uniref:Nucleophile aminohydrolase n=1 Tax=Crepidotus variabilis TaxID=179855 RepID=A0A9P6EHJ7_9AGAR|nr:nucleophile aminohydrolase [Crepidotus variabilis]